MGKSVGKPRQIDLTGPNGPVRSIGAERAEMLPGGFNGIGNASSQATASRPLRWMIESSRSAGPPGLFFPRSQSETRFLDTLR